MSDLNPSNDDSFAEGLPPRERQLVSALEKRDLPNFKRCLSKGANANLIVDNGWSLLLFAALAGEPRFVKSLIEAGADVNHRFGSLTVLMWAAFFGTPKHAQCAAALIEGNADLAARGKMGTALDIGVSWRNIEVAKMLKDANAPCSHTTKVAMQSLLSGASAERQRGDKG